MKSDDAWDRIEALIPREENATEDDDALYAAELAIARSLARWAE